MLAPSVQRSRAPTAPHSTSTWRRRRATDRRARLHDRARRRARIVEAGFWAHPLGWLQCAWTRFDRSRSLGLAAEMAFWLFLSLLPLAAVVGLITARLAVVSTSSAALLLGSLPHATRELVGGELGRMAAWNGGQVGAGAGLMFVWLASSGIHSIFDGIELATGLGAPRSWWKKRLLAIAACVALSLGASLLAVLGAGLGWLWQLGGGGAAGGALDFDSSRAGAIVRLGLGFAVSLGLVCGLYRVALPPGAPSNMPLVPGALLAIVLHVALGFAYALYLAQAGDSGAYLAGLASIGVTLMALYLFCLVLLSGIKVNQLLGERQRAREITARAA